MTDPIDEIRERVHVVLAFKARGKDEEPRATDVQTYIEFLHSAPQDMATLFDRIDELERRVRMYEVVKS